LIFFISSGVKGPFFVSFPLKSFHLLQVSELLLFLIDSIFSSWSLLDFSFFTLSFLFSPLLFDSLLSASAFLVFLGADFELSLGLLFLFSLSLFASLTFSGLAFDFNFSSDRVNYLKIFILYIYCRNLYHT